MDKQEERVGAGLKGHKKIMDCKPANSDGARGVQRPLAINERHRANKPNRKHTYHIHNHDYCKHKQKQDSQINFNPNTQELFACCYGDSHNEHFDREKFIIANAPANDEPSELGSESSLSTTSGMNEMALQSGASSTTTMFASDSSGERVAQPVTGTTEEVSRTSRQDKQPVGAKQISIAREQTLKLSSERQTDANNIVYYATSTTSSTIHSNNSSLIGLVSAAAGGFVSGSRASLRKQSLSNQLDSCGSSDSGQGSTLHSIATSSMVSIAASTTSQSSSTCSSSESSTSPSSGIVVTGHRRYDIHDASLNTASVGGEQAGTSKHPNSAGSFYSSCSSSVSSVASSSSLAFSGPSSCHSLHTVPGISSPVPTTSLKNRPSQRLQKWSSSSPSSSNFQQGAAKTPTNEQETKLRSCSSSPKTTFKSGAISESKLTSNSSHLNCCRFSFESDGTEIIMSNDSERTLKPNFKSVSWCSTSSSSAKRLLFKQLRFQRCLSGGDEPTSCPNRKSKFSVLIADPKERDQLAPASRVNSITTLGGQDPVTSQCRTQSGTASNGRSLDSIELDEPDDDLDVEGGRSQINEFSPITSATELLHLHYNDNNNSNSNNNDEARARADLQPIELDLEAKVSAESSRESSADPDNNDNNDQDQEDNYNCDHCECKCDDYVRLGRRHQFTAAPNGRGNGCKRASWIRGGSDPDSSKVFELERARLAPKMNQHEPFNARFVMGSISGPISSRLMMCAQQTIDPISHVARGCGAASEQPLELNSRPANRLTSYSSIKPRSTNHSCLDREWLLEECDESREELVCADRVNEGREAQRAICSDSDASISNGTNRSRVDDEEEEEFTSASPDSFGDSSSSSSDTLNERAGPSDQSDERRVGQSWIEPISPIAWRPTRSSEPSFWSLLAANESDLDSASRTGSASASSDTQIGSEQSCSSRENNELASARSTSHRDRHQDFEAKGDQSRLEQRRRQKQGAISSKPRSRLNRTRDYISVSSSDDDRPDQYETSNNDDDNNANNLADDQICLSSQSLSECSISGSRHQRRKTSQRGLANRKQRAKRTSWPETMPSRSLSSSVAPNVKRTPADITKKRVQPSASEQSYARHPDLATSLPSFSSSCPRLESETSPPSCELSASCAATTIELDELGIIHEQAESGSKVATRKRLSIYTDRANSDANKRVDSNMHPANSRRSKSPKIRSMKQQKGANNKLRPANELEQEPKVAQFEFQEACGESGAHYGSRACSPSSSNNNSKSAPLEMLKAVVSRPLLRSKANKQEHCRHGTERTRASDIGGVEGHANAEVVRERRPDSESEHGNEDDDYFYDDELTNTPLLQFGHQQPTSRFCGQANNPCKISQTGRASNNANSQLSSSLIDCASLDAAKILLSRLALANAHGLSASSNGFGFQRANDGESGANPTRLLIPSTLRRVSCPAGNPASLLSAFSTVHEFWRHLLNRSEMCSQCVRHKQLGCAQASQLSARQQHQNDATFSSTSSACDRKSSQTSIAAFSDYFSSFDQTSQNSNSNQANGMSFNGNCLPGDQFLASSSDCSIWRELETFQSVKRYSRSRHSTATNSSPYTRAINASGLQLANARCCCGRLQHAPNCPTLLSAGCGPELRRQSTITGFDHHKYTAHRSPSLCLPNSCLAPSLSNSAGTHLQRRQLNINNNFAPGQRQNSPSRLLSPTQSSCCSTPSCSPSPTNWSSARPSHKTASGPVTQTPGQRTNYPHQVAASNHAQALNCQQNQPAHSNVGNYQQGQYQNTPFNQPASASCRPTGRVAGGNFARSRLESLESDRSSSPSWSASTSSLRSSLGSVYSLLSGSGQPATNNGVQAQNGATTPNTNKVSGSLAARTGAAINLQAHSQQTKYPLSQIAPAASGTCHGSTSGQRQEQVYFFLCCCQRAERSNDNSLAEDPPAQSAGGSALERGVSLVARSPIGQLDAGGALPSSAIVDADDSAASVARASSDRPKHPPAASDPTRNQTQEHTQNTPAAANQTQSTTVAIGQSGSNTVPSTGRTTQGSAFADDTSEASPELIQLLNRLDQFRAGSSSRRGASPTSDTATVPISDAERAILVQIRTRIECLLVEAPSCMLAFNPGPGPDTSSTSPSALVSADRNKSGAASRREAGHAAASDPSRQFINSAGATSSITTQPDSVSRETRSESAVQAQNRQRGEPAGDLRYSSDAPSRQAAQLDRSELVAQGAFGWDHEVIDAPGASEKQSPDSRPDSVGPNQCLGRAFSTGDELDKRREKGSRTNSIRWSGQGSERKDGPNATTDTAGAEDENGANKRHSRAHKPMWQAEVSAPSAHALHSSTDSRGGQKQGAEDTKLNHKSKCRQSDSQHSGNQIDLEQVEQERRRNLAQAFYLYSSLTSQTSGLVAAVRQPPATPAARPMSTTAPICANSVPVKSGVDATATSEEVKSGHAHPLGFGSSRKQAQFVERHHQQKQRDLALHSNTAVPPAGSSADQCALVGLAAGDSSDPASTSSSFSVSPNPSISGALASSVASTPATIIRVEKPRSQERPEEQADEKQEMLRHDHRLTAGANDNDADTRLNLTNVSVRSESGHWDSNSSNSDSDQSGSPETGAKINKISKSRKKKKAGDERPDHNEELSKRAPRIALDSGSQSNDRNKQAWTNENSIANAQARASIGSEDSTNSCASGESSGFQTLNRRIHESSVASSSSNAAHCMLDPAMHALRAQGADLDTGNGNFIMANRRRRSVHQVQLQHIQQQHVHQHQFLQQQQQQFVTTVSSSSGSSSVKKFSRLGMSHDSQQAQQPGPLSGRMLRQADRFASGAAQIATKALKRQFDKLRAANSIDEASSSLRMCETISNRPRFVSEPANKYYERHHAHQVCAQGSSTRGERARAKNGASDSVEMDESLEHASELDMNSVSSNKEFKSLEPDSDSEVASVSAHRAHVQHPSINLDLIPCYKTSLNSPNEEEEVEEEQRQTRFSQQKLLQELDCNDEMQDEREGVSKAYQAGAIAGRRDGDHDATLADHDGEHPAQYDTQCAEGRHLSRAKVCRVYELGPELVYDMDELETPDGPLANLHQWNYPIFDLASKYGDSILSKLIYRIFFDSGFFETFRIPEPAFFEFFHALEEGYFNNPYHNRIHAADVLHAVYYLTSQPIENFRQVPLDLIEQYDELLAASQTNVARNMNTCTSGLDSLDSCPEDIDDLHSNVAAIVVAAAAAAADSERASGIMGANLTALEVMALYTAAAMHDFQHPGRTNSFLVATNSPLALLYNDRSVLENHHSAASWALFHSGDKFNWLCHLEKDEFKRFRFMIIELILATDLMRHYELVSAFNKKLSKVGRHNIDWFGESDRLLVMEIIIKLADVNGPMKGHELHRQWTDRIAAEFYEQGDEERARCLPVSLYMDRSDPRLPELQKSFINHLVGPLSHSYAAAGFFPLSVEQDLVAKVSIDGQILSQLAGRRFEEDLCDRKSDQQSVTDLIEKQYSVNDQTKYWLLGHTRVDNLNKHFLRCVQTWNLRNNFLYWDALSANQEASNLKPREERPQE